MINPFKLRGSHKIRARKSWQDGRYINLCLFKRNTRHMKAYEAATGCPIILARSAIISHMRLSDKEYGHIVVPIQSIQYSLPNKTS